MGRLKPGAADRQAPVALSRRELIQAATGAAVAFASAGTLLAPGSAQALPPVWSTIPNQNWVVGQPVYLDLAAYCTDPEGQAMTFTLSRALPAGLTLVGSVISGTPTAAYATQSYVATADDGEVADTMPPARPVSFSID